MGAPVREPCTIATAIRIGNPASWKSAIAARDESGGLIEKVTDEQIVAAYAAVAATEGVFAEPACAAPVAGLKMLAERGYFNSISGDIPAAVTVTLTGHGLKDPDRAIKTASAGIVEVDAQRMLFFVILMCCLPIYTEREAETKASCTKATRIKRIPLRTRPPLQPS
jgi:threonine synthase